MNVLYGIIFIYNGNFINMCEFMVDMVKCDCCYLNFLSDIELLLNVFVGEL